MRRGKRVVFSFQARSDLAEIAANLLAEVGRNTARRWASKLERRAENLIEAPFSCAVDPDLGAAFRVAVVSPYVIIYSVDENRRVLIVRIVHGARDRPALFGVPRAE